MTFTDGYRVERVYFERLKSLITILKSLKDGVEDETVRTLIENAIDSDGAILLLYRNLGEAWAELADQVQKTRKMLQDLDEKTEKYHDELNERIDEVNNYLMALIRALEARMDAVEADLAQMGRLFTYDLQRVNDEYTLTESGQPVTWAGTKEKIEHVRPHFVTVRGSLDGEVTYLMPREYDTAQASGVFEWYSVGFVGNEIHEVTVTLLPDDSVNVAINTTDFAAILQRITNLETRMTTAEGDIDTLEQTAENHNERITDLETCCDDMQENVIPQIQTTLAGKQDALTAGGGIEISDNTIKNVAGICNSGTETPIVSDNEVYSRFIRSNSYGDEMHFVEISKDLSQSDGLYYNLSLTKPVQSMLMYQKLSAFDPDCKILLGFNLVVRKGNAYYFRTNKEIKVEVSNGILIDVRKILGFDQSGSLTFFVEKDADTNYLRFGKRINNLSLLFIGYVITLERSKTPTEWTDFINTNWTGSTTSPFSRVRVFSTTD